MGKPAARVTDMHTCPMVTPGTPPIPHVGGPVTGPGVPNVLIGGMPAATIGDMCVCTGPPDVIARGSTGVFIGGKPAARMGDNTGHGGVLVSGCPTVLIGETAGGGGGGGGANPRHAAGVTGEVSPIDVDTQKGIFQEAAKGGIPFCEVCAKTPGRIEAEKKAQADLSGQMTGRDPDREKEVRKKAAEAGYPLMEVQCGKCPQEQRS
jgi:uncharacterized Zn-binding protein involved in type VI secretion